MAIPTSAADRSEAVDHSADSISVPQIWVQIEVQIAVDSVVQTVVQIGVPTEVRSAVAPSAADPSGVGVRTR